MNKTIDYWEISKPVRGWFYLVTPAESTPPPGEYIDFVGMSIPIFGVAFILELILSKFFKTRIRMDDALTSITAGSFSLLLKLYHIHVYGITLYPYFYEKRLIDLEYYSWTHWVAAAIAADFFYYWAHRFVHEANIGWATHQVHHSSEDYNISTALRQSIFQAYFTTLFYLGGGLLGIHPSLYFTHFSLNLTYQFWIHTEIITSLGPLEHILNTPSHHRVHHGRNPFCIDKNYAGVLIIWDRMFGTFACEFDHEEKIQYGLVFPLKTFDPFQVQLKYGKAVLRKCWRAKTMGAKFRALFYGPGFMEKYPDHRLGRREDLPKVDPKYVPYKPTIDTLTYFYAIIIGFQGILFYEFCKMKITEDNYDFNWSTKVLVYFLINAKSVAALLEGKSIGFGMEAIRYLIFIPWVLFYSNFQNAIVLELEYLSVSLKILLLTISLSSGFYFASSYCFVDKSKSKVH